MFWSYSVPIPAPNYLQIQFPVRILLPNFIHYFFKRPFQNDVKMSTDDHGVEERVFHHPGSWSTGCCDTRNIGACDRTWILYTPREMIVFNCQATSSVTLSLYMLLCPIHDVGLLAGMVVLSKATRLQTLIVHPWAHICIWMMILRMKVCDNFWMRHKG